jgi:formyl-CoA transferase
VLDIAQALAHEQTAARGMTVETQHPTAGSVTGLGLPIHFSEARGASRPPPMLGEHTREVLHALGYSEAQITTLQQENAVLIR